MTVNLNFNYLVLRLKVEIWPFPLCLSCREGRSGNKKKGGDEGGKELGSVGTLQCLERIDISSVLLYNVLPFVIIKIRMYILYAVWVFADTVKCDWSIEYLVT